MRGRRAGVPGSDRSVPLSSTTCHAAAGRYAFSLSTARPPATAVQRSTGAARRGRQPRDDRWHLLPHRGLDPERSRLPVGDRRGGDGGRTPARILAAPPIAHGDRRRDRRRVRRTGLPRRLGRPGERDVRSRHPAGRPALGLRAHGIRSPLHLLVPRRPGTDGKRAGTRHDRDRAGSPDGRRRLLLELGPRGAVLRRFDDGTRDQPALGRHRGSRPVPPPRRGSARNGSFSARPGLPLPRSRCFPASSSLPSSRGRRP